MGPNIDRRTFLSVSAASVATLAIGAAPEKKPGTKRPLAVAPANGLSTVGKVMDRLKAGADPLDAAIEGVAVVESDPHDHSIGYGGLPNAEGFIELDAAVVHGPTHASGAVAAMRDILHPAAVARAVMQRTGSCLVVGDGARKFAKACGFPEVDLLSDETRKLYKDWKDLRDRSRKGEEVPGDEVARFQELFGNLSWLGSMYCLALDTHGDLAGLSVSPGLGFKIPGRVGDTPILGTGLYLDNEVGACCSTGTGELNLLNCSCYQVVENLRRGMNPDDACADVCRRIVRTARRNPRLAGPDGRLKAGVVFYCLTKDGKFGGSGMFGPRPMAVHDGENARLVEVPAFPLDDDQPKPVTLR